MMADNWQRAGVEFIVKDSTRTGVAGIQRNLSALDRTARGVQTAFAAVGLGLGIHEIGRALTSVLDAAKKSQDAQQNLAAALAATGDGAAANIEPLKRYASELQRLSVFSSDEILNQMAYARNLGVSEDKLDDVATAAVGLSAKLRIDLPSAMMLVARASQGQTQNLSRQGIVLDKTMSRQEKYAELLRIGAEAMPLATAQTQTLTGAEKQLGNAWSDLKTIMAEPFIPDITRQMRDLTKAMGASEPFLKRWAGLLPEGVDLARDLTLGPMVYHHFNRPTELQNRYEALPRGSQTSFRQAYESERGKPFQINRFLGFRGSEEDEAYATRLVGSYERARQRQIEQTEARLAAPEKAVETPFVGDVSRVSELNARLKEQITIQSQLAAGKKHAAEMTAFQAAAEEAYGKGTEAAMAAVVKYGSALEYLGRIDALKTVEQLDEELETNVEITRRTAEGHAFAAEELRYEKAVWEAYGDDVQTATQKIQEHTAKLQGLQKQQEAMAPRLKTWGDIARQGVDDLSSSLTDVALDFDNAGDYADRFLESLSRMAIQEMVMRPVLQGVAGAFGFYGEGRHTGGVVGGPGGGDRFVRGFHEGGTAMDEIVAVLRKREVVLTEPDANRLRSAGVLDDRGKPRFHEGGTVGGTAARSPEVTAASGGRQGPANLRVQIKNESGSPVAAESAGLDFDAGDMVVNIVLKDFTQGGRTRDYLRR